MQDYLLAVVIYFGGVEVLCNKPHQHALCSQNPIKIWVGACDAMFWCGGHISFLLYFCLVS
ncbi:MAG TPA: hypothetical protein DIU39_06650 [Flavobacteriales bacterium]|nr:hypothetical protein [Flavobacteriales bacterium]|tara:strand:+ start:140702 stop:140884 length:183 start_codon:yes stop_codon:yes gene_type:complete